MPATETNTDILKRAYAAFVVADVPAVLACFAPDVRWESVGPHDLLPMLGVWEGHAGMVGFFTAIGTAADVLEFAPEEYIASADTVIAMGRERMRVRATGIEVAVKWIHVFRFRNGLITEGTEWSNSAALVEASRVR